MKDLSIDGVSKDFGAVSPAWLDLHTSRNCGRGWWRRQESILKLAGATIEGQQYESWAAAAGPLCGLRLPGRVTGDERLHIRGPNLLLDLRSLCGGDCGCGCQLDMPGLLYNSIGGLRLRMMTNMS